MNDPMLRDGSTVYVLNERGTNRFSALVQSNDPSVDTEEVAKHIQACFNACRTIPTEQLQAGVIKEAISYIEGMSRLTPAPIAKALLVKLGGAS